MYRCQDKARDMKTLKKECDLLKGELKISQKNVESLDKDHIAQVNNTFDKTLSKQEVGLQVVL